MSIESIIRGAPLFNDLYDHEVDGILANCHVMQLQIGEKVFKEGDVGEDLFLVLSGKIDIIKIMFLLQLWVRRKFLVSSFFSMREPVRRTHSPSCQLTF